MSGIQFETKKNEELRNEMGKEKEMEKSGIEKSETKAFWVDQFLNQKAN